MMKGERGEERREINMRREEADEGSEEEGRKEKSWKMRNSYTIHMSIFTARCAPLEWRRVE